MTNWSKLIAMVAIVAAIMVPQWFLHSLHIEYAQAKIDWQKERNIHTEAALSAQKAYDKGAQDERDKATKAAAEAQSKIDSLGRNLTDADSERGRLRIAYSNALASRCSTAAATSAAGQGETTSPAADLPAVMFGRVDDAAQAIAEFADRAMISSEACSTAW